MDRGSDGFAGCYVHDPQVGATRAAVHAIAEYGNPLTVLHSPSGDPVRDVPQLVSVFEGAAGEVIDFPQDWAGSVAQGGICLEFQGEY